MPTRVVTIDVNGALAADGLTLVGGAIFQFERNRGLGLLDRGFLIGFLRGTGVG